MGLHPRENWFRKVIYAVNALFVVFGVLLIVWGAVTIKNTGGFESVSNKINFTTLPVLAILLGIAIFVVSALAIVGTKLESYYITMVYSGILLIITILKIALVIWILAKKDNFLHAVSDEVKAAYAENNKENNYPFDALELTFDCCGLHNYQDYQDGKIPKTCCGIPRTELKARCRKDVYSKKVGCRPLFEDFWESNLNIVCGAAIVIILLEFGLLWIAFILATTFRNQEVNVVITKRQQVPS